MMGTALGGVGFAELELAKFIQGGIRARRPLLALAVFGGASSCNVAIEFGLHGPNSTNAMSCASGAIAIGEAFRQIRDGYADVMLAGGAEAPLMPLCFGAFALIRAMSTRNDDPSAASRPFDRARDGFVMAEGATVLVLEERSRALARGARIYAELGGYGTTSDAHHMTAPRPDGRQAARAMCLALADAHTAPHEVGYVNAHGSSTPLNDPTETLAVRQVFGEHAPRLAVSGTKGYYGHALGASGAFEAGITALAVHREWLPPTVNLAEPDAACDLAYLTGEGRRRRWTWRLEQLRLRRDQRGAAPPARRGLSAGHARRGPHFLAEFLGTFALVFVGSTAIIMVQQGIGNLLGVAVAHGADPRRDDHGAMRVSAHFNPAVTLGFLVTRRIQPDDGRALPGGPAARRDGRGLRGEAQPAARRVRRRRAAPRSRSRRASQGGQAFLLEAIATFILVFAVFGTAVDPQAPRVGRLRHRDGLHGGHAGHRPAHGRGAQPGAGARPGGGGGHLEGQIVYWSGPLVGGCSRRCSTTSSSCRAGPRSREAARCSPCAGRGARREHAV
jgi:hypothetical protein